MQRYMPDTKLKHKLPIIGSMLLALILLAGVVTSLQAQENTISAEIVAADLTASTKSVDDASPAVGQTVKFTLLIRNSGNAAANGITATDTIQPGFTYVADSLMVPASNGVFTNAFDDMGGVIMWAGNIGANAEQRVTFEATIDEADVGTDLSNTMTIVYDGESIDRSVNLEIVPPTSDLEGTKFVNRDETYPGEDLQYTLRLENSSNEIVTGIMLTDALPAGLTYVANTLSGPQGSGVIATPGFPKVQDGAILWRGSMGPGALQEIKFDARIGSNVNVGTSIVNTANVSENGAVLSMSATTNIVERPSIYYAYLPIVKHLDPPLPEAATLNPIDVVDARDGIYTVSWTTAVRADSYILEEDDNVDFSSPTAVYTGTATTWTVPSPGKTNDTYFYRVKSVNDVGESQDYSNIVSVTVEATFLADDTTLTIGDCTDLKWDFTGIQAIEITFGYGYEFTPVTGVDEREICPSITTTYEARVTYTDDTEVVYTEIVTVAGGGEDKCARDPIIYRFDATTYEVEKNEDFSIFWEVECAQTVDIIEGDNAPLPTSGNNDWQHPGISDTTEFSLRVRYDSGDSFVYARFTVVVTD